MDWKEQLSMLTGIPVPETSEIQPQEEMKETSVPRNQQPLRISMERSGRGGKTVTLIRGFQGNDEDRSALGKWLKQQLGVGGSVKDGEIIIQGDHRERVSTLLKGEGYTQTRGK